MSNIYAKKALADPGIIKLLKIDNYIAGRDLAIRVVVELLLIIFVYHFFQSGRYVIALCFFYILAIWHSFWGYAGIGHELMHGRVFSDRRLNKYLYYLASGLVWSNASFFKDSHLLHHAKTFSEDDYESKGVQKWGVMNVFYYLTVDWPLMFRRILYVIVNSFGFKYLDGCWRRIPKTHQIAATSALIIQISIGYIIYYFTINFIFNLFWILLPFTGQLINKILAQSQHMGLKAQCNLGPLSYSRTVRLPKLLTFLYAGMNYHAEHHLIPSIPYYNLGYASELLVRNFRHEVIDWRKFYLKDFVSIVRGERFYN